MAAIPSKDTRPEMEVRARLHAAGYRFRVHAKGLPGSPDVVFTKRRAAVFVHGCFWHAHPGCPRCRIPRTRTEFWTRKLARNAERDAANEAKLRDLGWRVLVVWECEHRNSQWFATLAASLGPPKAGPTPGRPASRSRALPANRAAG